MLEHTMEQFEVFDINVRATLLTAQKALPSLNEGASVGISSCVPI
jgi:hypothetical protein